ncbi:peptide ABC transporter substrate-binding protein, partial [Streptomyces botrytidirepellens]
MSETSLRTDPGAAGIPRRSVLAAAAAGGGALAGSALLTGCSGAASASPSEAVPTRGPA